MNQRELAERLDVEPRTIQNWLSQTNGVSRRDIEDLAAILDLGVGACVESIPVSYRKRWDETTSMLLELFDGVLDDSLWAVVREFLSLSPPLALARWPLWGYTTHVEFDAPPYESRWQLFELTSPDVAGAGDIRIWTRLRDRALVEWGELHREPGRTTLVRANGENTTLECKLEAPLRFGLRCCPDTDVVIVSGDTELEMRHLQPSPPPEKVRGPTDGLGRLVLRSEEEGA